MASENSPLTGACESTGDCHKVLDSKGLAEAFRAASAWLDVHVSDVNDLNVFPVPDGDTGTNMSMTMHAALEEVEGQPEQSLSELAKAMANGALMRARGNSGVILSQILRGFARAIDGDEDVINAVELAQALEMGASTAYQGVMKPVEGTILTVIREAAATAVAAASPDMTVEQLMHQTVSAAQASLARTPSLLPVLAEAGVVDAGGQGLVFLLEGFLRLLQGYAFEGVVETERSVRRVVKAPEGTYNYDTQFIILGDNLDVQAIREHIAGMGDSVLVVGDSHRIKVHVHLDKPGQALDYGVTRGHITDVVVENMQLQYEEFKAASMAAEREAVSSDYFGEDAVLPEKSNDTAVVAVVSGKGLERIVRSVGADAIVPGGQTMNPSTEDLLQAVESVPNTNVVLLPNNGNIILAANQARELSDKQVAVVPTKTVPEGISALLAFNYQADLETNVALMSEATNYVRTAEITRAVRGVQINGLSISEGEFIGLLDGNLLTHGKDISLVVERLLSHIEIMDYEIITLYYGEDVSSEEAEALADKVRYICRNVEVEVLDGGQAHYHYIISVE
ncbi:MAG: DAK2 domain-containing protein [Chloroflexota bacterium]|nr:DAK2 domain-containing protein [Chloroflexota bacterium]